MLTEQDATRKMKECHNTQRNLPAGLESINLCEVVIPYEKRLTDEDKIKKYILGMVSNKTYKSFGVFFQSNC